MVAKMKKIILMGFYGGFNFGDEVILENIIFTHKEEFSKGLITICCPNPDYIKNRFSVRSFKLERRRQGLYNFYQEMKKNDLLIVGGGGLLQDYGNFPHVIITIMSKVFVAILLRKPVIFYSIGIGPIETIKGKFLTGFLTNFVNLITVRDEESKELLHRLWVRKKKVYVLPDPAFGTIGVLKKNFEKHYEKNKCIGISILPFFKLAHNDTYKDTKIRKIITEVCNYLIEKKDYSILLFPCHEEPDAEESLNIINGIHNKNKVSLANWNGKNEICYDFFEKIDFLISMRLHPQIIASLFGIPFISIVYHPKVASLLKMLEYTDFSCDLESVTTERILLFVDRMEKNKEKIYKELIYKSNFVSEQLINKMHYIKSYL